MQIDKFNQLIISGFDVSFNYDDVFYTISRGELDGRLLYFLGDENYKENSKFECIDDLNNYKIKNKSIKEIIESLKDNEIYF